MNKFERYHKAVSYLEGFYNLPMDGDYIIDKKHTEVYLLRMRYFLELIGNPDKDMKFIHIAGTSGKGSVTNMIHEVLYAAGKKVGSFTSPSVTTIIEKTKVNDKYISPDEFVDIVDYLKPVIDKAYLEGPYGRPSYFEILFAVSLVYFQRQKCEWVVLEVGLGGRYDATNIIIEPIVTAITSIDYDHTEILGKTLEKIAYDKAGIIKTGSVFFTTEQRPSVLKIFKKVCIEKNVSMNILPKRDSYQEYNEELVTAISEHLNIQTPDIKEGIGKARLACRFEIIQKKPMVILDGAHNPAKIDSTIHNLNKLKYKKLHLIIGMANDKDCSTILEQIIPCADRIYFTRFQNKERKSAHPKELLEKSKQYFKKSVKAEVFLDAERALDIALKSVKSGDIILVAGSFFLAGELRKRWISEETVLKNRNNF